MFWLHQALIDKLLGALNIDRTPGAALLARSKADGVTIVIDALPDPINPADTECFIDGLGPANAWFARTLLVVTGP